MTWNAIYIEHLHKAYGSLRVLHSVDLEVIPGEVFGLLGPNGAGKTTLIHTILGLLKPDRGEIRVFGERNPDRFSERIGYLPERQRYHPHFTGIEYLSMLGRLSGLSGDRLRRNIRSAIELVGLEQAANRRIGTYSKGMLQRIGLAQAVIHDPSLLIVDEPASGLDPEGQHDMGQLLQALRQRGHTIFLCTHQLANVAPLCDRVGVLVGGRIKDIVSLEEVYARGHSVTIHVAELPENTAQVLQTLSPQIHCNQASIKLYPISDQLMAATLRRLLDDGVAIRSIIPEMDALEQYYRQATRGLAASLPQPAAPTEPQEEILHSMSEDR
jgi:ABC-2 type transport system ATP-binding protein